MEISKEWRRLWKEVGVKGDSNLIYSKLKDFYSEPHRKYHNLNHITSCLNEFKNISHLANNPQEVEMAIWFHDIIYNTRKKDNEEKSAEMSKEMLKNAKLSNSFIYNIYNLILATKHNFIPKENDTKIMVDVDLSSLGKPEEEFNRNGKNIREEYEWVPESTFKKERKKILQNFLDREFIYSTDIFRKKYEKQAKENLKIAIKNYESKYKNLSTLLLL